MIPRYTLPEMAVIWSEEARLRRWLEIECLAVEGWARLGKVPRRAAIAIRRRARIVPRRMERIEAATRHDVTAFLAMVMGQVGPMGRYLHMGLTSSDVVDTALACQLVAACDLIAARVTAVRQILRRLARRHRYTLMIGRTHGVHAEPITFGLKLAVWYDELGRHGDRLAQMRPRLAVGKLSGAVGTYANIPPAVERYVLPRLGLKPAPVSTQVIQRDRHAEYFAVLAEMAGTVEKIAVEIRHLQRTEVREVEEPFGRGQQGSSAMPHKRNPVMAENLTGLARLVRQYAGAALENIVLWHERDISHSSVERVIGPDASIAIDFMLHRLAGILSGLRVDQVQMRANLERTDGLIFSQQLLLALVMAGCTRTMAYRVVQRVAMRARQAGGGFRAGISADPVVARYLTPAAIAACFDPRRHTRHVDAIFRRVFH
ncbi:MAG: adenylosuccinate lyase [Deltaproteobacteria bacterium]|nr:adenylosuccinate lyase [Deltaproteobacteria bacterium]